MRENKPARCLGGTRKLPFVESERTEKRGLVFFAFGSRANRELDVPPWNTIGRGRLGGANRFRPVIQMPDSPRLVARASGRGDSALTDWTVPKVSLLRGCKTHKEKPIITGAEKGFWSSRQDTLIYLEHMR